MASHPLRWALVGASDIAATCGIGAWITSVEEAVGRDDVDAFESTGVVMATDHHLPVSPTPRAAVSYSTSSCTTWHPLPPSSGPTARSARPTA